MNKYVCFAILFLLSGALSSCSFHRLVSNKKARSYDWRTATADTTHRHHIIYPQPDTIALAVNDTAVQAKKMINDLAPLWQKRFVYKTFSGKAKVHYEGPDEDQEFTAHFRIRKDSLIWIAITGLGGMVQVARIYITPDSFIMVNQLHNEVTRISLNETAEILPTKVDFPSIQRLLVGEPLRDGTVTRASGFGGSWSLQVEDSAYIQVVTYNKTDSTLRTGQLRTRDANGPQAMMEYGGYAMMSNQLVSTNRVLHIQNKGEMYILDMNFQRTDFDMNLEFPVSVPANYTRKELKKQ